MHRYLTDIDTIYTSFAEAYAHLPKDDVFKLNEAFNVYTDILAKDTLIPVWLYNIIERGASESDKIDYQDKLDDFLDLIEIIQRGNVDNDIVTEALEHV